MLQEFIYEKMEKEGPSWLDNEIYIECPGPHPDAWQIGSGVPTEIKSGWNYIRDAEGWIYVRPAWSNTGLLTTTFKDEKITTLNINY